ncbi:MAG: hypothetical protein KJO28_11175 [Desulfofustis sp.]|nr:hypothetical protein [Desulfofustis sp.]NNF45533.1 hypothetical protein [Desulfofustis sp.]NNK57160.1 hypothetical protein [Desulfofustis sp.]
MARTRGAPLVNDVIPLQQNILDVVAAARFLLRVADNKKILGKTLREIGLPSGLAQGLRWLLVKVPAGTVKYNRLLAPSLGT